METKVEKGSWGQPRANSIASRFRESDSIDHLGPKRQTRSGLIGIGLLGLADDLGVKLNNGRPGAAQGPDQFRQCLARYGNADSVLLGHGLPELVDFGNIVPSKESDDAEQNLIKTHERVQSVVTQILEKKLLPICIGGGHDLTLPAVQAVSAFYTRPLSGAYLDAHLDVRDSMGSGMPFRGLLERKCVNHLEVCGIDPFVNAREHIEWFLAQGGSILQRDEIEWEEKDFVSLDLDSLDASFAPGVSAPNPSGMTVAEVANTVRRCGQSDQLKYFDMMEFCPLQDFGQKTGRLMAHLFCQFLAGWIENVTE